MSTEGADRDRDRGIALGANAYLTKPFDPEMLRATARKVLASVSGQARHALRGSLAVPATKTKVYARNSCRRHRRSSRRCRAICSCSSKARRKARPIPICLNDIFRAVHTLKGLAGMFGMVGLVEPGAHARESAR